MPVNSCRAALATGLILAAIALVSPIGSAQEVPQYKVYLLPLVTDEVLPGAYGSKWLTETWVHNGTDEKVRLSGCVGNIIGLPPTCDGLYAPHTTQLAVDIGNTGPVAAALAYIPVQQADRVTLSHRLFELSKHAQPTGVQIPVVPEDRFYKRPMRLIAVPSDSTARVAIRMYNVRGVLNAAFRIEFFSVDGSSLAAGLIPVLSSGDLLTNLGIGVVGDAVSMFPQLATVDRFDVRITPIPADMEFWAMATVTDRDTQHVLVVTAD